MKDQRSLDALSLEELEEVLRLRRREARIDLLRERRECAARVESADSRDPSRAPELRRFRNTGAGGVPRRSVGDQQAGADGDDEGARMEPDGVNWGWIGDKGLLVAELGVLTALILVLLSSLRTLREINREVGQTQILPTLTATAAIRVVLPGGYTPSNAPAEVPAHLRGLVGPVTPIPVPTPGPEQAIRIEIPAIDVDAPVFAGDDDETLKRGAGHRIGSANPGERGNCVISAHSDVYGEIFRDLPALDVGDEVFVHTASRVFRYVISQRRIIDPTEISVLGSASTPVLTLVSCYPYGIGTHRIVVTGELQP